MKISKRAAVIYGLLSLAAAKCAFAVMPASASPGQVGVAAAVRGDVKILSQTQGEKRAQNGQSIFLGDQVTTDKDGNLQILLLDETTFTIGPNSAVAIDKFVYDPETQDGNIKARVAKGVFRFVTGKIGQKNPQQMEVDIPFGTIGIRGTIVAGEVVGKKSTVVLLGPGEKNNTPHRQGKFTLTSESGGKKNQQTVSKTGFGSTISGEGEPPSRPYKVSSEEMGKITGALGSVPSAEGENESDAGASGDSEGGEGNISIDESPTEEAGQDTAEAGESVGEFGSIDDMLTYLSDESDQAAQESLKDDETGIQDGYTTWDDLEKETQITGGVLHYSSLGFDIFNSSGTDVGNADFQIDIDLTNRKIGGGHSIFQGNYTPGSGGGKFQYSLGEMDFSTGESAVIYEKLDISNSFVSAGFCPECDKGDVRVEFSNQDGVIAALGTASLVIRDVVPVAQTTAEVSATGNKASGAGAVLPVPA